MARKTPVLLRRAPLSGGVSVLTNYRRGEVNGRNTLTVVGDGKHDVTAAFYALVLEELMDGKVGQSGYNQPCPDIVGILDGAAAGLELNLEERGQLRQFRERFRRIVEDHNARSESGELANA